MGGKTLRSIGLARTRLHLNWKVASYNLQRFVYLKEAGVEACRCPRSVRIVENEQHNLKKRLGKNDARALLAHILYRHKEHGGLYRG
ncbi:hypothetical protein [Noviherbaspirillum suwonense]|uniref:Transposase n=1 Tax=Noviherbaspirillum suwonense TaxID=1224511 RepID=A0ABY1QTW6_9BURK|nr:hypothetical protein SAMN06295970_13521 [Noviherbaspirillum suwonense]